ncbi:MAG: flavodoxin family protein [Actinomycetes bacterium]
MFGNTEAVARAIADGVATQMSVDVRQVADAPHELGPDVGLLVVGGPTHAFGMTLFGTRKTAVNQGAHPTGGPEIGLREWIAGLRPGDSPPAAATFDTRLHKRWIPGSAARKAQKQLRRLGLPIAAEASDFYVSDTPGPLLDGELTRARTWGSQLGATLVGPEEHHPDT